MLCIIARELLYDHKRPLWIAFSRRAKLHCMKGKRHTLTGTVVRGRGYGQKLGFPTANIDREEWAKREPNLRLGVYAGTAELLDTNTVYRAGIVLGPLDETGFPKIEAHLLDFSGVLYGRSVRLSFINYLRPFISFADEKELKGQIKKDLAEVRKHVSLEFDD